MDEKKATKNPLGDLLRSLPPEKAAAAFMGAMEALEKAKTVTTTAKERVMVSGSPSARFAELLKQIPASPQRGDTIQLSEIRTAIAELRRGDSLSKPEPRRCEVEPKDGCADCPLRTHWMCNMDNAIANDEMQGESLPLSCPLRGTAGVLVRAKA